MEEAVLEFLHQLQTGQFADLPNRTYILIAVLTLFEGPLTTVAGAVAASMGLLNPGLVFLSASTGNLAGDVFWHSLGRAGKLNWFLRYGHRIGVKADRLDWFQRNIRDHAPRLIFLTKVSSSFIIPSLISTGLARLPWRRWFPALLSAEILWTGSLIALGYFAAQAVPEITVTLKFLPVFGVLVVVFFAIVMITRRLLR